MSLNPFKPVEEWDAEEIRSMLGVWFFIGMVTTCVLIGGGLAMDAATGVSP